VYGSPATSVSGDGTGTSATFAVVNNLVFNPTDTTLFVSDNNLVRIIDVATQAVQTLAGMSGVFTSQDSTDGTGATASFSSVKSIVFDNGELYVVDGNNLRIMSSTTGDTNTLIHSASAGYANGPATSALLNSPTGLTFDGYNTLYIADSGNNAVRKLDLDTNTVSTVLGGPGYTGNDDGLLTVAQMANPQSVYFLNAGSASGLFVGNSSYFKIIH
jgi:sugar lactone lactonase YvrE